MSPELRAELEAKVANNQWLQENGFTDDDHMFTWGGLDAILQFAEKNPTIPDRALCQCWGDVIKAAIPAALWEKVSK